MKINAKDYLTHIDNADDVRYLRFKLFDVNMRIFHNHFWYRKMVQECCAILGDLAVAEYSDYKKPHGMSGANAGIPFNIIAIVTKRGQKDEGVNILINPKIINYDGKEIETFSNCGSIRLKEPIKIKRWEKVTVRYFDCEGNEHTQEFRRNAATIQHEIDHNNGVLITDRQ